ncbi:ABC transporter ATP-binding protein [Myxococcota bacterium]|nr:ABC transporter ATP-binding protein [Myxococcota bacterium]
MSAPIVRLKGLQKTFIQHGTFPWSPKRTVAAVRGVDLTLGPGDILALVGQSGSGKTTLSRLVLGLEEPTGGEVWLEDQRWDGLTERQRAQYRARYQYVPQDPMAALDPQQTALEHVMETLRVLGGRSRDEARTDGLAMLARLGLGARADALPRQMSGGEQRRVTLARVLALHPRLVVADEPTSGLEPDRREEVLRDLIGNLPKDAACILVTHDMSAARKWTNRTMVMLDGRVIETLRAEEDEPAHPYSRLLFDPWSADLPRNGLAAEGCPFRLDCPHAVGALAARCAERAPTLTRMGENEHHHVACYHHAVSPPPVTEAAS